MNSTGFKNGDLVYIDYLWRSTGAIYGVVIGQDVASGSRWVHVRLNVGLLRWYLEHRVEHADAVSRLGDLV